MSKNAVRITNLSPLLDETILKDLFSSCGKIVYLQLKDDTGAPGGRECRIAFAEEQHAQAAVCLNGSSIDGSALIVEAAPDAPSLPTTNAAINTNANGSVAQSTEPRGALSEAQRAAQEAAQRVAQTHAQGAHSYHGAPAPLAPQGHHQSPYGGFVGGPVSTQFLPPHEARRIELAQRTVYIGNLPYGLSSVQLFKALSTIGPVAYAKVSGANQSGVFYGFVEFESSASAIEAVQRGVPSLGNSTRISHAKNPIIRAGGVDPKDVAAAEAKAPEEIVVPQEAPPVDVDAAMQKVREAQEALARKMALRAMKQKKVATPTNTEGKEGDDKRSPRPRSRSRSRSHRRHRRGRHSRSRSRSRSGSRGRSHRRHRYRRRSRSRSPYRRRRPISPIRGRSPPPHGRPHPLQRTLP